MEKIRDAKMLNVKVSLVDSTNIESYLHGAYQSCLSNVNSISGFGGIHKTDNREIFLCQWVT